MKFQSDAEEYELNSMKLDDIYDHSFSKVLIELVRPCHSFTAYTKRDKKRGRKREREKRVLERVT
jgi:hypothetical protein